ncbi:MAG: glycosyltransferase [Paludibacter sp.]|nr:glycosyltransferase [Paludibacter sp.]
MNENIIKNICFFNSVKFWGGGEKLHLEYAVEFKKKGYNIILAAAKNSPLSEKGFQHDIQILPVSVGNLSFLNLFKIIRLVRFYKSENIDTVIFSTSHDLKLGSISAKLAGVKNIVYLRGLAVPIRANFINFIILNHILTHIVANSDETKKRILQNFGKRIDEDKVKTIYHGIDIAVPNFKANKLDEIATKGRGVILGNAGRLTPQKGQKFLIEIAKKLKDKNIEFTLFIAGTGELQNELKLLIETLNLQKEVILLGFVKDMDGFMNSIDVFLLTSLWEGFGYVLVEAMIKSKPVLAFDLSSNPEIITADKTGYLINYPDLDLFVQKAEVLITDESLRKQLGENGKESAIKRFNLIDRITEFEYYLLGKDFTNNEN